MINQLIRHRERMLVLSIGIVYLWFGGLKFFPGVSPAETLAKETLSLLAFHLVPTNISYFLLALWEVTIGIFLVLNLKKRFIIYLGMLHILFTFTPLVLLPGVSFNIVPVTLTIVGQYIIKNLIIFSAFLYFLPESTTPSKA